MPRFASGNPPDELKILFLICWDLCPALLAAHNLYVVLVGSRYHRKSYAWLFTLLRVYQARISIKRHQHTLTHTLTHTHTHTLSFFKQETQLSMWWVTKSQQRLSWFFFNSVKNKKRKRKKSSVKINSWVQMGQHNWKTWVFNGDSGQRSLVTDSVGKVKLYGTWKLFRSLGKVLKPIKTNKATTTTTKHTKKADILQTQDAGSWYKQAQLLSNVLELCKSLGFGPGNNARVG